MEHKTMQYRPAKRERMMKPVLGAAAVMAAMATLGLAVIGPAALSRAGPVAEVQVLAYRSVPLATEVAILPGTIQVVGKKTKTARAASPFVPASYNPRG